MRTIAQYMDIGGCSVEQSIRVTDVMTVKLMVPGNIDNRHFRIPPLCPLDATATDTDVAGENNYIRVGLWRIEIGELRV